MSESVKLPLVLIGGGGHASVLVDILLKQGRKILAVVSPDDVSERKVFSKIRHLYRDEDIREFSSDQVQLVNGIGMLPRSALRTKVNERFLELGYQFETVIASNAIVSPYACIAEGAQILSGSIVNAGAEIGGHSIINTGAIVEHDCRIGRYNHIAPRATLCGQVYTGSDVYVGAGATVIQCLSLADKAIVGAGATIVKNLEKSQVAYSAKAEIRADE